MESRTVRRVAFAIAACVGIACTLSAARADTAGAVQRGLFALLGAKPAIVAYAKTTASSDTAVTLTIRQFMSGGQKPIRHYDVDMQMLMHVIVVRDDFAVFMHLHPSFDATAGTFEQSFARNAGHRYYVFADSDPRGIGQQVFRFTVDRNGATPAQQPSVPSFAATPSPSSVRAGPYTIALSSTRLPSRRGQAVTVNVSEAGHPARDLEPYLGAAAHAVFIGTADLSYVHVHPFASGSTPMGSSATMHMSAGEAAGPHMLMELPPLPAGTYKLWIQFQGAGRRYAAPFTILAR